MNQEQLYDKNAEELDLSSKKLDNVPQALVEMSSLKSLNLEDNNFSELPVGFGKR
jgi:Leucine-rich repeat (LRR) protein